MASKTYQEVAALFYNPTRGLTQESGAFGMRQTNVYQLTEKQTNWLFNARGAYDSHAKFNERAMDGDFIYNGKVINFTVTTLWGKSSKIKYWEARTQPVIKINNRFENQLIAL